jgi:mannose-6-phosphate isomerase
MAKKQLQPRILHKVWGRRDLPPPFAQLPPQANPVGEIWFEHADLSAAELLVKYIFTSEKLSIQVHPDAAAASGGGVAGGKDEAWLILGATKDAVIGLGPKHTVSKDELRQAAIGGTIEQLIDWRSVKPGDFYYSPATTIHAIGAGVSLIEVQQNVDATYRLFDYDRERQLHLEEGLAVADLRPFSAETSRLDLSPGRCVLAYGGKFVVELWTAPFAARICMDQSRTAWLIPITSGALLDNEQLEPGNVWAVQGSATITPSANAQLLVAYPGSDISKTIEFL